MTNGRGAWSSVGMPTVNPGYYQLSDPLVGSSIYTDGQDNGLDEEAIADRAVNFGCRAIQIRLNTMGAFPKVRTDGVFDNGCQQAVIWAQQQLKVFVDGSVGPLTAHALWHARYSYFEKKFAIPSGYLCGLAQAESGQDPGAVGWDSPDDKGIVQINVPANPTFPLTSMFFAISVPIKYAAERLASAHVQYGTWPIAIASYNDPALADKWQQTGTAPNQQIADYVAEVTKGC